MLGYQEDGKRLRKSFYGKTQKEVKQKVAEFRKHQEMGLTTNADILFNEWAQKWYDGYKDKVTETTYESYRYSLKVLKDTFGNMKLRQIKPLHVEKFLSELQLKKSDSSVAKCRGMLHQIMHKAEANDLIIKNPVRLADKLKRKKPDKSKKDAFTMQEISVLLKDLPQDRMGHTVRLMIATGLRSQEVVCLEKQHIEADGSLIRVRQAVETVKGKCYVRDGHAKSDLSMRDILVPEFIRESAVFLRSQANRFIWDGKESDTVFNLRNFRKHYFDAIGNVQNVRPLTPHCCRHTYVTQLQTLGVALETIKDLAGHADTDTTVGYLHVQDETVQRAINQYSAALERAFFQKADSFCN
jgi:site-specific recombinase XerD